MIAYEVYYPARRICREKLPILDNGKIVLQDVITKIILKR